MSIAYRVIQFFRISRRVFHYSNFPFILDSRSWQQTQLFDPVHAFVFILIPPDHTAIHMSSCFNMRLFDKDEVGQAELVIEKLPKQHIDSSQAIQNDESRLIHRVSIWNRREYEEQYQQAETPSQHLRISGCK